MRWLVVISVLWLCSCAMFRKTNRESVLDMRRSSSKLESSQLVLKSAGKETRIFTYWNDSGVYKVEYIREQLDQAKLTGLKTEEKQQAKQKVVTRKTEPISIWIYIAVLISVFAAIWFLRSYTAGVKGWNTNDKLYCRL